MSSNMVISSGMANFHECMLAFYSGSDPEVPEGFSLSAFYWGVVIRWNGLVEWNTGILE